MVWAESCFSSFCDRLALFSLRREPRNAYEQVVFARMAPGKILGALGVFIRRNDFAVVYFTNNFSNLGWAKWRRELGASKMR